MSDERRQRILETITAALRASGGRVDPQALAAAIDKALDGGPVAPAAASDAGAYATVNEGKTPDQLNAGNDDGAD